MPFFYEPMPTVLCRNVRLNRNREERRCRRVLGEIPAAALRFLKNNENLKFTYPCPSSDCKWVSISYVKGKLTFNGQADPPDFENTVQFDDELICTTVA